LITTGLFIAWTLLGWEPTVIIAGLAALGWIIGLARIRSANSRAGAGQRPHSLIGYYASYVALWTGLPAFVFLLIWVFLQGTVIDHLLLQSMPPEATQGLAGNQVALLLAEVKNVAAGRIFGTPSQAVLDAAARYSRWVVIAGQMKFAAIGAVGLLGLALSASRIKMAFRARQGVERIINILLLLSSTIAVLTTVGIVASLAFEALRFFQRVPVLDFLFGLRWEPQVPIRADQVAATGAFGVIPVFSGTLLISGIAILFATVLGLPAAIYLSEFASDTQRRVIKPVLEILSGVPTIVYGFFAVLVISPAIRAFFGGTLGLDTSPNSALGAGLVMGVMIVPFVSSLSDDAINAVPQAMRDGSIALGATRAETMLQVLLPAALPGIVGGMLLAISRAIGETMIVVMAAGIIASLTANPLDSVTTVTVQIVTLLIGDSAFDNPKTLSAFGLGLFLFVFTLILNVIALRIVQKYREQYE
jgi:phosphate transport system permease protein